MNTPVLLLAGGLGTRIRHLLSNLPKPMAPVLGKPFLEYQIKYLQKFGFEKFYLSVGYLSEVVIEYFNQSELKDKITYIIEKEPLGTGGAIKYAMKFIDGEDFYCLNADTLFLADFNAFYSRIAEERYSAAIALMKTDDVSRYGRVEIENNTIVKFHEKDPNFNEPSLINTGIYYLSKAKLNSIHFPTICSLEKDIFPQLVESSLGFWITSAEFIDIGTPETLNAVENFVLKNKLV